MTGSWRDWGVVTITAAAVTLAGCASDGGDSSYGGHSTSVSVGYG